MSIATDDERAAFEAAWSNVYDTGDFLLRHHTLTEQYANHDTQRAWEGWKLARAALPEATPTDEASPLMNWYAGVGLLWDVYGHGKWLKRVVSPIGWDAHTVYLDMLGARYAPHIEIRLVSSSNKASPAEPAQSTTKDDERAAWFAIATGAAASLEDAAVCMLDPDAKKSATGAAAFTRKRTHELWKANTFAQPVEQTRALTDAELTALIRKVEDKLGIVWFVPDDSETYAWRTTNTSERLKYARALLIAAQPASGVDG